LNKKISVSQLLNLLPCVNLTELKGKKRFLLEKINKVGWNEEHHHLRAAKDGKGKVFFCQLKTLLEGGNLLDLVSNFSGHCLLINKVETLDRL